MKVLLADDEPLCLIGMQSILNWEDLDLEVVAAVHNGAEAWDAIRSEHPDIVITDLKMPVLGGLELAEKCRARDSVLPVFIMLTNYEEFDYVKESLRLGAVEYLAKIELTAENLTSALCRAKERVQKERIVRASDPGISGGNLEWYREMLLVRLYSGMYQNGEEFIQQCARAGLHFDTPDYVVAYAVLEMRDADTEQAVLLCSSVTKMAANVLPKYQPGCSVTNMDLRHFAVLIPLQRLDGWEENLCRALEQTGTILTQYFSVRLQWAVGLPVRDILAVKDSLRLASSLLTQMDSGQSVRFYQATPVTALDYRVQLVARIQDYINKNLSQRLSLNDVASVFNFSPNYLSQLLSRNGEGFVEFVTAMRINAAKELMASTDLRIYEISDRVGFESASYFSKVFKKMEGMSPREYMQRLRR